MASSARKRIKSVSYAKYGYFFIIPFFVVYAIFMFLPLINTFALSFYGNADPVAFQGRGSYVVSEEDYLSGNYTGTINNKGKTVYDNVGLNNFNELFDKDNVQSGEFSKALQNTFIIWLGNFIPQVILSLALAVWFTDARLKIPGKGFFKVVMYMPNIITAASVAVLFLGLTTKTGPINTILCDLFHKDCVADANGIVTCAKQLDFLGTATHPWLARGTVMFIQTWMWFGNTMIMLMSGIMGINPSLFEAAEIDGANGSQTFWRITMPLLSPILLYTVITSMIGGLQMFDIPNLYRLPGSQTRLGHIRTVAVYIFERYSLGTSGRDTGYAAAASVILFFITVVLGTFVFRMNRDHDEVEKRKQRKKLIKQEKAKAKQFGGLSI